MAGTSGPVLFVASLLYALVWSAAQPVANALTAAYAIGVTAAVAQTNATPAKMPMVVYKTPTCGCCGRHGNSATR